VPGKLLRLIPTSDQRVDVSALLHVNRDECSRGDESANFACAQLTGLGIQLHGVRAQEQVRVVAVELRALMRADRILDRQRVQLQLLGNRRELRLGWVAIVQPHACTLILEVLGNVLDRKILEHELALAVQSSARHARNNMSSVGPCWTWWRKAKRVAGPLSRGVERIAIAVLCVDAAVLCVGRPAWRPTHRAPSALPQNGGGSAVIAWQAVGHGQSSVADTVLGRQLCAHNSGIAPIRAR
jgi:hypothetical protein